MTEKKAPAKSTSENESLKKSIGYLARKLDKVITKLEEAFGLDID